MDIVSRVSGWPLVAPKRIVPSNRTLSKNRLPERLPAERTDYRHITAVRQER